MDRRYYQRTKIDLESVFLLSDKDIFPREFNGVIEDISESGVKIVIDPLTSDVLTSCINVNDSLHFNCLDEYSLFGKDHSAVLDGEIKVIRKDATEKNTVLGYIFNPSTKNISNYVKDMKTSAFISNLR